MLLAASQLEPVSEAVKGATLLHIAIVVELERSSDNASVKREGATGDTHGSRRHSQHHSADISSLRNERLRKMRVRLAGARLPPDSGGRTTRPEAPRDRQQMVLELALIGGEGDGAASLEPLLINCTIYQSHSSCLKHGL